MIPFLSVLGQTKLPLDLLELLICCCRVGGCRSSTGCLLCLGCSAITSFVAFLAAVSASAAALMSAGVRAMMVLPPVQPYRAVACAPYTPLMGGAIYGVFLPDWRETQPRAVAEICADAQMRVWVTVIGLVQRCANDRTHGIGTGGKALLLQPRAYARSAGRILMR